MAFKVETSADFEQEAANILDWLMSQHAGETGMKWFFALNEAVSSLALSPHRCPLAPENASFPFQVRQLLYGRRPHVYRILFTIESETVYVLHIRHGRRLPMIS